MKKVVTRFVFVFTFMFASMANANLILSLDPATQVSNPGDVVSVTVMIDGLGDFTPLSLSAFYFDIVYDTSALTFVSYNLFDNLGDIIFFDAEDWSGGEYDSNGVYNPGFVNIYEFSWLTDFNFQPGSFALAELFFTIDALAINQTTFLSFRDVELVDGTFAANPIFVEEKNASIAVPTPATSALMVLALLTLFVRQKYYSSNTKRS